MGSNGPAGPDTGPEDEIVVIVTGFGPFKFQNPINPSWEIAKALPPYISPTSPGPQIRIVVHPSPVRVSYGTVRDLVPKLWASEPRIDYMIHVGMAAGRAFYSAERRAHRDGYWIADVDGVVLGDEHRHEGKGREDKERWVWEGCPEELQTDVDLDDVWRKWRSALPDIDIRPSEDAGRYLCDFIYYSSLAHLWKQNQERRVVFLHVPVESDEAAIEMGQDVLIELIRALVQSRKMARVVEQEDQKSIAK